MAEEINDGTAYLKALKRATSSQSGAAAAPARTPERLSEHAPTVENGQSFQGAEKRRSPRYKCEGSAEVREEGCDVRHLGQLHRHRPARLLRGGAGHVSRGQLLHMKLEVNGIRIETKGKVRICYPYLGMGIAFEEMSDENAAHLRQLLASLSRPSMIMGPGVNSPHPSTGPMEGLPQSQTLKPPSALSLNSSRST